MAAQDGSDSDDSLSTGERRLGVRHLACFPAYLHREDGRTRTAIIRDLSATGASLLVHTKLAAGDHVRLSLFIHGDVKESQEATARVVRVEDVDDACSGPWSLRIAVQFDEELAGVLPEIQRLAEHQAKLGV
jgi:PilZ domain